MKINKQLLCTMMLFAAAAMAAAPSVDIKEYDLPAAKSFPHDPTLAPDGSLWYTAMQTNKLGRLDPKTGEFKEYPLKTPNSGPHGLVADKDGNIWFTAIRGEYVGKLDPKTGEVKEYRAPEGTSIDPHTPVIDQNGMLWFTNEQASAVGRLDPRTGKMDVKKSPTPHAVPYGIVVTQKGVPIFCEFGTNKLASIDPKTMEIKEYTLPEGARPRRLALAKDGTIFYSDYARGMLGHFDPATGKQEEWASPGGPNSNPYGIAITKDGTVWYSESGVRPNTLVKFDPATKKFESTTIPSGGGTVRNMVATPDGRLYLACSGVNKVAVVTMK